MRKVKDAKELTSNELIYFKGHAKATYMSDGKTVEESVNDKVTKEDGKQLSTEDFTTALKQKLEGLSNYDDTELSEAISTLRGDFDKLVSGDTTTAIKTFNEVIAFLNGIEDSESLDSIIASIEQQIAGKMDKVTLATVATSGSYNDLSNKPTIPSEQVNADWNATSGKAKILNKPTIPSAVTESTVSGWGFTKNTGTYSKPSTGIPKSDLASVVQTSLGKADTALQSYTEQYKGTVTGVKMNGATKNPANGVVDLGTVITEHQSLSGKQDKLVSGTNIKTINGESILGSGNIVIQGGGSSSSSAAYSLVNHGTSDTTFTLTPNTFHVWDEVTALDLSFGEETEGVANEYLFQFTSGATATSLSLPDGIKWANEPTIAENMIFQISVLKGLASVLSFEKEKNLIENHVTATFNGNIVSVSTEYPVNSNIEVRVTTGGNELLLTIQKGEDYAEEEDFMVFLADIINITPSEDDVYIYKF